MNAKLREKLVNGLIKNNPDATIKDYFSIENNSAQREPLLQREYDIEMQEKAKEMKPIKNRHRFIRYKENYIV